jgi:predicted lipid-binding transport protein (Tim44 family)
MKRWLALAILSSLALTWIVSVCEVSARSGDFRSGNRATREDERVFRAPPDDDTVAPVPQDTPAARAPRKPMTWRSMLRGLLTGGLLGSVFYGRGFEGVGLLEVVILSALIAAAFWAMSRYHPEPAGHYAHAGAYGGSLGPSPAAGLAGAGGVSARTEAAEAVDLPQTGPALDPDELAASVEEMFRRIQAAWTQRDIAQVADMLTPDMRDELGRESDRLRASRRINRVERITVQRVAVTEAWRNDGWDRVRVHITATLVDYTTDEVGLKVLAGNPFDPVPFQERWELVRPSGPYPWRVCAIG